jgi:heme exporter protein D
MINQNFGNFHQFLAMGGFADYVWSAYGLTAAVLLWLIGSTFRQYKKEMPSTRKLNTRKLNQEIKKE